jgi:hypothetical protein
MIEQLRLLGGPAHRGTPSGPCAGELSYHLTVASAGGGAGDRDDGDC